MLLSQKEMEDVLKKALPHLSSVDAQKAAAALTQAMGKWQEIDIQEKLGAALSVQCRDICAIGEAFEKGGKIRAFITKA